MEQRSYLQLNQPTRGSILKEAGPWLRSNVGGSGLMDRVGLCVARKWSPKGTPLRWLSRARLRPQLEWRYDSFLDGCLARLAGSECSGMHPWWSSHRRHG